MTPSVLRIASCMAPNADDTCRAITCYLERKLGLRVEFVDDAEGQDILHTWGMTRFVAVNDDTYDPIRVMWADAAGVRLSVQPDLKRR